MRKNVVLPVWVVVAVNAVSISALVLAAMLVFSQNNLYEVGKKVGYDQGFEDGKTVGVVGALDFVFSFTGLQSPIEVEEAYYVEATNGRKSQFTVGQVVYATKAITYICGDLPSELELELVADGFLICLKPNDMGVVLDFDGEYVRVEAPWTADELFTNGPKAPDDIRTDWSENMGLAEKKKDHSWYNVDYWATKPGQP